MKCKKLLDYTTNSGVYKKLRLRHDKEILCWICFKRSNRGDIYAGCAYIFKPNREYKNWKHYRKTQYKNVEKTCGEKT